MKTDLKLLFYIKRTEVKPDGTCPLMGRITAGRTMAQFSTKLVVPVSLWDTRANRVSGKSTKAVGINQALDRINVSVNCHYQKLIGLNGKTSAVQIKNALQGIASAQETLVGYFVRHNEEFQKCIGINREHSTLMQYEFSLKKLIIFLEDKYKVSDIPFSKLDLPFVESLDFYLRVEQKLMAGTVFKIVVHIRRMIKLAIDEGIISRDPFEGYAPDRPKPEQKYLTREELDRIMTTQLDHPARYRTRDMFLFSVFTGLAYRDMFNLREKDVVRADDGVSWIRIARKKTGTPCEIPLLEIPLKIMEKYKGLADNGKLFPMQCNQKTNRNLKIIAKLCKIERNLIFHMGRHTYATEICLSQGVPMESLSRMLGHRDLCTTRIYAKITNRKIAEDLQRVESRIESKFQLTV
ncbi:Tyrosine recombinase XerD [termite gut metagenome]|uniref:Tyrosine recombinase XerD n=1 Tax=termite gut metagenome TaxID=433724 RepID=A0A5J4SK84_9ZZZZ